MKGVSYNMRGERALTPRCQLVWSSYDFVVTPAFYPCSLSLQVGCFMRQMFEFLSAAALYMSCPPPDLEDTGLTVNVAH